MIEGTGNKIELIRFWKIVCMHLKLRFERNSGKWTKKMIPKKNNKCMTNITGYYNLSSYFLLSPVSVQMLTNGNLSICTLNASIDQYSKINSKVKENERKSRICETGTRRKANAITSVTKLKNHEIEKTDWYIFVYRRTQKIDLNKIIATKKLPSNACLNHNTEAFSFWNATSNREKT